MTARLRNRPITEKLRFIIVLSLAWSMIIVFALVSANEARNSLNAAQEQLMGLARVTASNSQAALAFLDKKEAQQILDSLREIPAISYASLSTNDNLEIANFVRRESVHLPTWLPWREIVTSQPVMIGSETTGKLALRYSLGSMWADLGGNLAFQHWPC